jgi:TonB-linked SusC/RagA family outer membrane protein
MSVHVMYINEQPGKTRRCQLLNKYVIMRINIVALILFTSLMQAGATGKAQNITLVMRKAVLEEIFKQIEKQTPYTFLVDKNELINRTKINVNVKNLPLKQVLDQCFEGLPITYKIVDQNVLIKTTDGLLDRNKIYGVQDGVIKGTVTDENGEPIPGVSIRILNTNRVYASKTDGTFEFNAKSTDNVSFSYVGYQTQTIQIKDAVQLIVKMVPSDNQDLSEVVVLGFGQTQKKIAQTGSTASITTKELKQSPTANITNALAGRLPGLITLQRGGEPGKDASLLFIRGRATINNATPLVTIDGVQKDYSAITLLDVNEIESVTILKDASATALYGVKGANGVIIVTTKRGVTGAPQINVSTETGLQNPINVPEFLDSYNYAKLANEAYLNDNPGGVPLYSDQVLEHYRIGDRPLIYPNVDWADQIMKTGIQSRVNFNINGGSKQVKYFVNVGYLDQGGVYKAQKNDLYDPNANFKRYNFRSNVDIEFDKDFSIGLSLYGAIEDKRNPNYTDADIFWTLIQIPPNYGPVMWPNGYYSLGNDVQNPLWLLNESGYAQSFNSSLSGMFTLNRKLNFITEGLSLKANYSFDGYFKNSLTRWARALQAKYNNGYFEDPSSYTYFNEELALQAPASSYSQNRDVWMDFSLNYQRRFGNHEVSGLLLANRTQRVLGNEVPYVSQGLVGRVVYNYKYKYFAEVNGAYNGTDNFAKKNRYGLFPAFSAAYVLSEESFLKSSPVISLLKLRGSYGIVGNDQLSGRRWPFISEYQGSAGYVFGETLSNAIGGNSEGALSNPNVTWETAVKSNIGLELNLWKDLFAIKADVFMERRKNILISRNTVPGIIGASGSRLPTVNWGKVNNSGFEIELSHRNKIGQVNYFINSNFSLAKNKIVFMDEAPTVYPWQQLTGNPIGSLYGLTSIGFFQSQEEIDNSPTQFGKVIPGDIKYADLNNDGVINNNDEGLIANSNIPEVFYGASAGINWKNFDFSVLFQGSSNSYRQLSGVAIWEFFQGGKVAKLHEGRWTPENAQNATYPALHYGASANNFRPSSFYLDDTSYLRLKNVELGYTFKNVKLSEGKSLSSIRVYSNAINLHTWTKARLFDPENYNGYGAVYPPTRVINFGLSVGF